MTVTINELKQKLFQNVYDVYDIFKNHFGEDKVDLQNIPDNSGLISTLRTCTNLEEIEECSTIELSETNFSALKSIYNSKYYIFVWWPSVTVRNENDNFINIADLYARIPVNLDGNIPYECVGFELVRSNYTYDQFICGYTHSHIPSFRGGLPRFDRPCLGTGPIRNTIADLKNSNEEALWMLFCEELSRYVTVESLHGVPYNYLERVGSRTIKRGYEGFSKPYYQHYKVLRAFTQEVFESFLNEFMKYYLQHGHIKFEYKDKEFQCGMAYYDYMIDVSNAFIEWFNATKDREYLDKVESAELLQTVLAANGKFYDAGAVREQDMSRYIGQRILTFKGRDILLQINSNVNSANGVPTQILEQGVAMYILSKILTIINYHFDYEQQRNGSKEESSTIGKTFHYL